MRLSHSIDDGWSESGQSNLRIKNAISYEAFCYLSGSWKYRLKQLSNVQLSLEINATNVVELSRIETKKEMLNNMYLVYLEIYKNHE